MRKTLNISPILVDENSNIDNLRKQYHRDQKFKAKHQCLLKNNVEILTGKDVEKSLDYVNKKYGANFLDIFKSTNC